MTEPEKRWLEQRRQGWYAVIYVPARLQSKLGKKLRKSLGTRDLLEARRLRHSAVAGFIKQIEDAAHDAPEGTALEALMTTADRLRDGLEIAKHDGGAVIGPAAVEDGEEAVMRGYITDWAEQAGEQHGPEAGSALRKLALGEATPLCRHMSNWLREGGEKGPFSAGVKVQHGRTIAELEAWMKKAKLPPTIQAIGRREAGRFVTEHLTTSGRVSKTVARIISACRGYWTFLIRKGIVASESNPWDRQAPSKGLQKGLADADVRPFTDDEVRRLLAGPAKPELADLMRMAALTGMRIEEIYMLQPRDVEGSSFIIRQGKARASKRTVPIHPDLVRIVARRIKGKAPAAFLFDEPGVVKAELKRSATASKLFGRYRQRRGIDVHEKVIGKRGSLVVFHSFRKWFTTAALRAGQPVWVVDQVTGHTPQGMTLAVYSGGATPEMHRACVEAVQLPTGTQAASLKTA